MQIELRSIDQVKPYPGNPRTHDAAGIDAVAKSIAEFGFRQPLVIEPDGTIIIGHGRFLAAQKLGIKEVPVHVARELTPAQVKALRVADNQLHELSDWDYELLPIELSGLQEMNVDLGMLGFDQTELARLMSGDVQQGLTNPDDVPEPPDEAITKPGDIWVLGNHRLMCGDSSKPEDLDRLLAGASIHLVNSDPPYNVSLEPRSKNAVAAGLATFAAYLSDEAKARDAKKQLGNHQGFDLARDQSKAKPTGKKMRPKDRPLQNDFVSDEAFDKLLEAWFGNIARVLLPGRAFYIWGGWTNISNYPAMLKKAGLFWHQEIIWVKNCPVLCRKDFMLTHEWCFYGWREGAGHEFFGPNNIRDVWEVDKVPQQKMVHLTEKPVELAIRAIQYSSLAGENVLDLFGGSGSTLIAAEQTDRHAFLMELDALYCDVIVQRWENFTGKKAERIAASGQGANKTNKLGMGTAGKSVDQPLVAREKRDILTDGQCKVETVVNAAAGLDG